MWSTGHGEIPHVAEGRSEVPDCATGSSDVEGCCSLVLDLVTNVPCHGDCVHIARHTDTDTETDRERIMPFESYKLVFTLIGVYNFVPLNWHNASRPCVCMQKGFSIIRCIFSSNTNNLAQGTSDT